MATDEVAEAIKDLKREAHDGKTETRETRSLTSEIRKTNDTLDRITRKELQKTRANGTKPVTIGGDCIDREYCVLISKI